MLLTDYFRYPHDATWDFALQSGVTHGVIRLPETDDFEVPVRVDHVPTYAGEDSKNAGYDAIGRLFAIGYLKGISDAIEE